MKDRDKKGFFIKGNKVAEKWTENTVMPILTEMWQILSADEDGQPVKNIIRANDIKTLGEICIMADITYDQWEDWKKKFKDTDSVSRIIKKIECIIENRMIYSGQTMDIFVLKNKYGYTDKQQVDHTTKGEKISDKADLSKMSADELNIILKAKNIINATDRA